MCFIGGKFLASKEFNIKPLKRWIRVALVTAIALVTCAVAGLIFVARNPASVIPYVNDAFARENLLANVPWPVWLYALPLSMLLAAVYVLFFHARAGFKQAGLLLAFNAVWLEAMLVFVVPRVEAHTQGAAIEFYEALQDRHADVLVYGYKSYAHLYYARKQPNHADPENLLLHPVKRPLFVVTRIDRNEGLVSYPGLEFLYRRNGFEFYRKMP